jgi:hypothetical protein
VKRVESKERDWSVVGFKRKLSEVGRIALNERLSNSDCALTEYESNQSIESTQGEGRIRMNENEWLGRSLGV